MKAILLTEMGITAGCLAIGSLTGASLFYVFGAIGFGVIILTCVIGAVLGPA